MASNGDNSLNQGNALPSAVRSSGFFAAYWSNFVLLGLVLTGLATQHSNWESLTKGLGWPPWAFWVFVVAVPAALAVPMVVFRRPTAMLTRVESVPPDLFLGREKDVENWFDHVDKYRLVWLNGESGSGKSTFIRRGLIPRLEQSRRYVPLFVDLAGAEWDCGTQEALARSLGLKASATLAEVHEALHQEGGVEPVLVFDQVDDYQAFHKNRFILENCSRLSADELCAQSAFWGSVRKLLEKRKVRCVFVTRNDSLYGLEMFRLIPTPKDTVLLRLAPGLAYNALLRVVPESSVTNPEHGWTEFARLLCRALDQDGNLPVRMVLAFRGLGHLANRPIRPGKFDRLGELPGLVTLPLTQEILDASKHSGCRRDLIREGLVDLVDPNDPTKTRILSVSQLTENRGYNKKELTQLARSFELLAEARIVRQSSPGHWSLGHDYLTHAVRALDDREGRSSRLLIEAAEKFRLTHGWRKLKHLLTATQWLDVANGLRRGNVAFRNGDAGFFVLSGIRVLLLVIVPLLVVALTPLTVQSYVNAKNERVRRLVTQIYAGLDVEESSVELAVQPRFARRNYLRSLLNDRVEATNFVSGRHCVLSVASTQVDLPAVLLGFDDSLRKQILAELDDKCGTADVSIGTACAILHGRFGDSFVRFASQKHLEDFCEAKGAQSRSSPDEAKKWFEKQIDAAQVLSDTEADCLRSLGRRLDQADADTLLRKAVDANKPSFAPLFAMNASNEARLKAAEDIAGAGALGRAFNVAAAGKSFPDNWASRLLSKLPSKPLECSLGSHDLSRAQKASELFDGLAKAGHVDCLEQITSDLGSDLAAVEARLDEALAILPEPTNFFEQQLTEAAGKFMGRKFALRVVEELSSRVPKELIRKGHKELCGEDRLLRPDVTCAVLEDQLGLLTPEKVRAIAPTMTTSSQMKRFFARLDSASALKVLESMKSDDTFDPKPLVTLLTAQDRASLQADYENGSFPSANSGAPGVKTMCLLVPHETLRKNASVLKGLTAYADPDVRKRIFEVEPDKLEVAAAALDGALEERTKYPVLPESLQYVARDSASPAWERLRWPTLSDEQRVVIAARLYEIYGINLDPQDFWGFAGWARNEHGIDLSLPLKPPARSEP